MLRFSIRDVLWLIALVSLGLCLWIERDKSTRLSYEAENWKTIARVLWRNDELSKDYTLAYYDDGESRWVGLTPKSPAIPLVFNR